MTEDSGDHGAIAIAPKGAPDAVLSAISDGLRAGARILHLPPLGPAADDELRAVASQIADARAVAILPSGQWPTALELGLAAEARVAPPDAVLRFPGIATGLSPGGGAAVRLTRLGGVPTALDLLLTGRPLTAEAARAAGIVDVVEKDVATAAGHLLARIEAGEGRRSRPHDYEMAMRAISKARAGALSDVSRRVVALIEGAILLPEAAALEMDRATRADLSEGRESRGLRYAAMLGRPAKPGGPDAIALRTADPRVVVEALTADLEVTLLPPASEEGGQIEDAIATALEEGIPLHGERAIAERAARLRIEGRPSVPAPFGLLAMGEAAGSWRDEALTLSEGLADDAPLAVFVEWNGPDALSAALGRPVTGWHRATDGFVEILDHPGDATDASMGLAGRMGLCAIRSAPVGPAPSIRLWDALAQAADDMVEQGTSPYAVDAALRRAGFAKPPFVTADREGHAVWAARRARLMAEGRPRPHSHLADTMVEAEWTGDPLGYYDWRESEPRERPDVLDLVEGVRLELGLPASGTVEEDPARRVLLALVAAGARLIEERIVSGPAEIDLACLHAVGTPRGLGGPMFWAAEEGLVRIAMELAELAGREPMFAPTALLLQSADAGAWLTG